MRWKVLNSTSIWSDKIKMRGFFIAITDLLMNLNGVGWSAGVLQTANIYICLM